MPDVERSRVKTHPVSFPLVLYSGIRYPEELDLVEQGILHDDDPPLGGRGRIGELKAEPHVSLLETERLRISAAKRLRLDLPEIQCCRRVDKNFDGVGGCIVTRVRVQDQRFGCAFFRPTDGRKLATCKQAAQVPGNWPVHRSVDVLYARSTL